MTYDLPNYNQLKSNSSLIKRTGGTSNPQSFSGIYQSTDGLRIDQTPIGHYNERLRPFDVNDLRNKRILTNVPHKGDVEEFITSKYKLTQPEVLYKKMCDDSRVLPYVFQLEDLISKVYSNRIIDNLINVYSHSPMYFTRITSTSTLFEQYQLFIYLLEFINYIEERRDIESFIKLDDRMKDILEWTRTRRVQDIDYLLIGPTTNTNIEFDYVSAYSSILSPSKTSDNINDYLMLTTTQSMNTNINKAIEVMSTRSNVFYKTPNIAGSYTISIDSDVNGMFQHDDSNNLVVNCMSIDLGNSNSESINLNVDEALVSRRQLRHDPKIASKKLDNLMNKYTMFNIKNLLVLKSTYKTSLNAFDKVYIVFPGITMDGRFNQVYTTGTLQVSGYFKEASNEKYWMFVPDNDNGIVYNPTTVHVTSFEFYISNRPTERATISYNNYELTTNMEQYYNCPLIVQSLDPFEPDTYLIRMNELSSGELHKRDFTFLYDRTHSTLQLLQDNYTYDSIPRYKQNTVLKNKITVPNKIYPNQVNTYSVVEDKVQYALSSGESIVYLDKVLKPLTREMILDSLRRGFKSVTIEDIDYPISYSTIDQVLNKVNTEPVSIEPILNNEMSIDEFCMNAELQYANEYTEALKTYNSLEEGLVNEIDTVASRDDFTYTDKKGNEVVDEYSYLRFNGLFKPDYNYNVSYNPISDAVGSHSNGEIINNNFVYPFIFLLDPVIRIVDKQHVITQLTSDFLDYNSDGQHQYNVITSPLKYITYPNQSYTNETLIEDEERLHKMLVGDIYTYGNQEIERVVYDYTNEFVIEVTSTTNSNDKSVSRLVYKNVWRMIEINDPNKPITDPDNINYDYDYNEDPVPNCYIQLTSRQIPSETNLHLTYHIDSDLLSMPFSIDDFMYSYAKYIHSQDYFDKPYFKYNDLGIREVRDEDKLTYDYTKPVKIKYFVNHISRFDAGLMVNSDNYGFSSLEVKFKNIRYVLENINNDLFGISYVTPMDTPSVFYSCGSRIKMIIELK